MLRLLLESLATLLALLRHPLVSLLGLPLVSSLGLGREALLGRLLLLGLLEASPLLGGSPSGAMTLPPSLSRSVGRTV